MEYKIGPEARCAVVGHGSWATTIVGLLAAGGQRVGWYVRNPEVLESLRREGRNPRYLSDVEFDRGRIDPSDDLDAVVRGFGYMFEAQYDNGGWPQFYPLSEGYYTHITYNDDVMVNVLKLMRDAMKGKEPFGCLPDSVKAAAAVSLDKGVDCILKTQVVQDGRPTVWCAQYDENTLKPAKARAYELVSLSGQESDDIVLFLMSLSKPSPEVRRCVEDAVAWFKKSMIKGMRMEKFTNADGKSDVHLVPCTQDDAKCAPLWARFYTIEDNRPFFSDRDSVIKFDISEIGYERRNGYKWFNSDGLEVFERYETWHKKYGAAAAE